MNSFIHPFIPSSLHSFIHSFIHSFAHIHSFMNYLFIHSFPSLILCMLFKPRVLCLVEDVSCAKLIKEEAERRHDRPGGARKLRAGEVVQGAADSKLRLARLARKHVALATTNRREQTKTHTKKKTSKEKGTDSNRTTHFTIQQTRKQQVKPGFTIFLI